MYDGIVSSHLRFRLGLPGRFYQIHDTTSFTSFLGDLPEAGQRPDSDQVRFRRIHNELREILPQLIHREFTRADLSRRFCRTLFERMGYSAEAVTVQEGSGEAGSDIVVTVGDPLLLPEFRVGVQVFSYEGVVEKGALQKKLKQLLGGWEKNDLDCGVLLTTGHCNEAASAELADHNKEHPAQLVRLIEGNDLADLFLKHYPPSAFQEFI